MVIKVSYYHPDTGILEDEIHITGVKQNINLARLANEKVIRADDGTVLRIEPYEFTTGAYLQVNADHEIRKMVRLTVLKPRPGDYSDRNVELEWPMDKLELYPEADFDSGVLNSPLQIPVSSFPANNRLHYYVNPLAPSDSERDILIHAQLVTPDPTGVTAEDNIRVTNMMLDLDVDSNNDGIVEPDNRAEDKIEYVAIDKNPGKIIGLNNGDEDADGVLDFADFEITTANGADPLFARVHFRMKSPVDSDLRFKLLYSDSDPAKTKNNRPANGYLRLWRKPAEAQRSPDTVKNGGDFLAASKPGNPDTWYTADELFGSIGESVYYLEAVNLVNTPDDPSTTIRLLTVPAENAANTADAKDIVRIFIADIQIAMDGDRDGAIEFDNPADKEYLFWVNDDCDWKHYNDKMFQEDDKEGGPKNCNDDTIGHSYYDPNREELIENCKRDLEDFTQLHLRVDSAFDMLPDVTYHFQFTDVDYGDPQVNLFKSKSVELFDYLTDSDIADKQILEKRIITVADTEIEIDKDHLKLGEPTDFLLEGKQAGKGRLAFIVKSGGVEIARKSLYLDLREIGEFYQKYKVDITHDDFVETTPRATHGAYTYKPGTDDYILFVHGYNIDEWLVERWAETMFKRLWWQGYDGHVGMYRWPEMGSIWFNQSEIRAWRSAEGLRKLFEQLNSAYPGKVRVLAHSQGNVVTGEAIQLSTAKNVHTYIASQAALSVNMYDRRFKYDFARNYPLLITDPETPDIYSHYWSGSNSTREYFVETGFRGKVGKTFNFCNMEDWALDKWRINNVLKPAESSGYGYNYMKGFFQQKGLISRTLLCPGNRDEIFSYCAESRSDALGATEIKVKGFDKKYLLQRPPLRYDGQHYSHSREFRSNIVDERIYWFEVIENADLTRTTKKP